MVLAIVIGAIAVLVLWFVAAVGLALVLGRAARIGEVKYQDARFLRDVAEETRVRAG